MSMAPREANANSHSMFCDGQPPRLGQRQYAPSRTSFVPQDGQLFGNRQGRALFGRFDGTGATTPVRPVWTKIPRSGVVRSSGGNLYAMAHRGALLVAPSSS